MAIDAFLIFTKLGDAVRMDGDSYDEYMDKKFDQAWSLQLLTWSLGGALGTATADDEQENREAQADNYEEKKPAPTPANTPTTGPGTLQKGASLLPKHLRKPPRPVFDIKDVMKPPSFKTLEITKELDTASPALLKNMWERRRVEEMKLLVRKAGVLESVGNEKLPGPSLIFTFGYVYVNDVQWNSAPENLATETVSFWYGKLTAVYKPQKQSGGLLDSWTKDVTVSLDDDILKKLEAS